MKRLFRRLLRQIGFVLLHRADDPILAELRELHETLRLDPHNRVHWDDSLPQPAAHACLRNLLQLHRIDLVLDVGANRGQFARLARRVGYAGEIVSFEPLRHNHKMLHAAAAADGHWRVLPFALGREPAEMDFAVHRNDSFSSLHAVNEAGVARFGDMVAVERIERVQVRTLDSVWPELGLGDGRRLLLKTDTQGHDLAVLAGASEVLRHTLAVATEASIQPIYTDTPLFPEVVAWLQSCGFVLSGVFPTGHRPDDLALIEVDAFFTRPPG
jgi:FkbM family methyltransferase